MAANVERTNHIVNWNIIPPQPTPKWYELTKTCKTAAKIFFTLSAVLAGAAVLTVITFSAVPIALGLGGAAAALVIAGLILWNKKPSENDPDRCRQLREEAGRNIEENRLSYPQIRAQYPQLINRALITNHDLNDLLKEDLNHLSYPQFIQKHNRQIITVLRNHPENFQAIQNKYLDYLASREDFPGIRTLPTELETSALAIGYEELAERFANVEALREHQNYEEFIRRNGVEALPYVTDETALKHIEDLFLEQAACLNEGVTAALQHFSASLEHFSDELKDRMIGRIVEQEIAQFMDGRLSYPVLRQRNGLANITPALTQDPIKNKAREFILSLPYRDMNGPAYAEDRALLGITKEDILNATYKQAEGLPYFGKNGFKGLYGLEMLCPERMSKSHAQQIKDELTSKILECPFDEIKTYLPEFAKFDLQLKDILVWRWEKKPLRDLIAQEEMQFFEVLPGGPRSWTAKVLREAKSMTAGELLKLSPKLFTSGILNANDLQAGVSLQSMFEQEIATVATFETLLEQYGEIIFQQNLISKENDTLDKLIKEFLERNSVEITHETQIKGKIGCRRVITEHKLLKKSFQDILEEAVTAVRTEKQRSKYVIEQINSDFRVSDRAKKNECDTQIAANTQLIRKELDSAEETFRSSSKEKQRIDRQVTDLEGKLSSGLKTLKTVKEEIDSQTATRKNLQAELHNFPSRGDVRVLTTELVNLKDDISRKEQVMVSLKDHLKQSSVVHSSIAQSQIHSLNWKLKNLEMEEEACRRDIHFFEKAYLRRKEELSSLEEEAVNRRRETVPNLREPLHARRERGMPEREPLNRSGERESLHRDRERREAVDSRLTSLRRDGGGLESKLREAKAKQTKALSSQSTIKSEIRQLEVQLAAQLRTLENDPRLGRLKEEIIRLKKAQEAQENQLSSVKEILKKISNADERINQLEKEKNSLEAEVNSLERNLGEAKKYQTQVEADYKQALAVVESKTQELKRIKEPLEKKYQLQHKEDESQRVNLLKAEKAIHKAKLAEIDTNFKSKLAPTKSIFGFSW